MLHNIKKTKYTIERDTNVARIIKLKKAIRNKEKKNNNNNKKKFKIKINVKNLIKENKEKENYKY